MTKMILVFALVFDHWGLFVIWYLVLGASPERCRIIVANFSP